MEHGIKAPACPIGVKSKHGQITVKLSAATPPITKRCVHLYLGVVSVQSGVTENAPASARSLAQP